MKYYIIYHDFFFEFGDTVISLLANLLGEKG